MKDGTTSVIITVDAMNFGLLAEEEQDGVMYAYASLLNSINYPIQIVIKSQTKDVTGYLLLLREQEEIAPTKIMKQRIRAYREFVGNLIHDRNVLDKKFYVCIPASSIELGLLPPSTVVPGTKTFDISSVEKNVVLEKARNILEPKRDHLISQFARIGLFSRQLNSQEIIQLFYVSYNPEAAEGQQLADSSNYTTPLVTAGIEGSLMNTLPSTPSGNQTQTQTVDAPAAPVSPPQSGNPTPTSPQSMAYQPTQMPTRDDVTTETAAPQATPPTGMPTPSTPEPAVAVTEPTPTAPSAALPGENNATPVQPSMTIPTPQVSPVPGGLPIPAAPVTPPPSAVDSTPSTAAPTAIPEAAAQNTINQTIGQLGGDTATPPTQASATPAPALATASGDAQTLTQPLPEI